MVAKVIEAEGGFVFTDYKDAVKAAYRINYPNGPTGQYPKVPWDHFRRLPFQVFDEPIYVGPQEKEEAA